MFIAMLTRARHWPPPSPDFIFLEGRLANTLLLIALDLFDERHVD
ncbi:hypothetical protein L798_05704 [Zootermopsis nevadensis]|uniref:Uncharacterized protein n=1 Tax=Zootermopsis nevadensis TaxID=136037 RepID=A0A067R7B5_ZOONE|nr:hypothetical protein L798_05704 [Zootermopsis nevadensis]